MPTADPKQALRPLLKRSDVAHLAQLSECQVARLGKSGRMPAPVIAKHNFVRYDAAEIRAWMAGRWVATKTVEIAPGGPEVV